MTKPILIGEINSYSAPVLESFLVPYRKGIEFGLEQVNAAGGVLQRPLEFIFRDDRLSPVHAAEQAEQLIVEGQVDLLAGAFTSDIGVAIGEVADRRRTVYIASEPRTDALVWDGGSRYVFRLRTCQSSMISMLIELAVSRPEKRWAVVAPSYGGGQRIRVLFKEMLEARRGDIEWVGDYAFELGALDSAAATRWLAEKRPEAMLTVVYGGDLAPFVRAGNAAGVFRDRLVVNPLAGEPEYLDMLGPDTPEGWVVLGYPARDDERPAHRAFRDAYVARHGEDPQLGALLGHMLVQAIAAGISRAGSVETEPLVDGFEGLRFSSPIGEILIRAADHQSTMGAWRGTLALRDDRGVMENWVFLDGGAHLPSESEAARRRPDRSRNRHPAAKA